MKEIILEGDHIDEAQVEDALGEWREGLPSGLRRVLLLPPDITRSHALAGMMTGILYRMFSPLCPVDIMPALGTHTPMSPEEIGRMFGDEIPRACFYPHDWRREVTKIGVVPADYVREVTGGLVDYAIDVAINRRLLDPRYDLIISVGQVVPHEVAGMANYTKNILVGCGGKESIDKTHFLGAAYGMERIMGRDPNPVRLVFDYAETHLLQKLPLNYLLTVTQSGPCGLELKGLYGGRDRHLFEAAVRQSLHHNLEFLHNPLRKVVVYLDPAEFKSTWLGNKAIYRTRMAIADGGELVIIAPGLKQFGEDTGIDALIRKYGYAGSKKVLEWVQSNDAATEDLRQNLSAAAHLIHGSSEGRFHITYAPGHLTPKEIEQVHFRYLPLQEALRIYDPTAMRPGFQMVRGEEVFYIANPALGLWALREKFDIFM